MTPSRDKPTQGKIIQHPSQGAMKNLIQFGQNSLDQDLKGMGFSTYSFKGWKVKLKGSRSARIYLVDF